MESDEWERGRGWERRLECVGGVEKISSGSSGEGDGARGGE